MTPDWSGEAKGEWHQYAGEIKEVIVEEGITGLGTFAFSGLANLSKVTLPEGLTTLSADAFSYNASLKTLVLPATITTVNQGVTYQTENIDTVYYGACAEAWTAFVASITAGYNDSLKNASPVFDHECDPKYDCTDEQHTLVCGTCGFVLEETADHDFGEWNVTEEPEVGKPGKKEKNCGTCGHKITEPIDALEPDPVDPPATGDTTALFALMALLSTAALCLGAMLKKKKI